MNSRLRRFRQLQLLDLTLQLTDRFGVVTIEGRKRQSQTILPSTIQNSLHEVQALSVMP
jgi:hypothetical protein